jgi:anaerobic selenocysteine-containing dehydrogenase
MATIVPAPSTTVLGACPHDCPDTCAWQVTVADGVAVKLVGDAAHPITRGGLCAKVNHYLERVYSADRLLYPMRRSGPKGEGRFERVHWDEALDDISQRLKEIAAVHGPTAVLPFSYLGTMGLIQGQSVETRFFSQLGATRLVRAVCGSCGGSGIEATIGTRTGMLPVDIAQSRFIVLWGTNTVVTNLHLWPFIREAKANGATVVVVDPARTRTAQAADWHVQPKPGTDAALALGMMHVIVGEGLHDADYVERHTLGFDRLCERLTEYPPVRVAELTGLESDEVVRLARAYASTRPAAIRLLVGMEHHAHGAMAYRSIACLPALVGAWRERGGGLLYMTAGLHFAALNAEAITTAEDPTVRSVNMVQLGRALTDPTLDPPIKALVVWNANPAATAPNQRLVLEGLRRDDLFTVVHEQFLTDTARHADYVLPATTQLEHLDLMWSWGHDYLALNRPAIAPLGEAIPNTELFRRLAERMRFEDPAFFASDEALARAALDSDHPHLAGITYDRLVAEGWVRLNLPDDWRPFAEGNFPTPSGKCEFWSDALGTEGIDPQPGYEPASENAASDPGLGEHYPLALVAAKGALHFLNSSYANLPRPLRAEQEPRLDVHPTDAAPRGITDGDEVRVFNRRGEVRLPARVGDGIRPGVVAMPSGWWASLSPGGAAANALTADGLSDRGEGGDFHDTLVEVVRIDR